MPKENAVKADRFYLICIAVLIVFGLLALISASGPYAYSKWSDSYYFLKHQVLLGLLPGVFLFLVLARISPRLYQRFGRIFYVACLILLICVFIPGIGSDSNKDVMSWIDIGFIHFQPAEFMKLAIIFILADLLSDPQRNLSDWKHGLLPVLGVIAPAMLLIVAQPDIGTLVVIAGITVAMLYLAGTPKSFLFALSAVGVAGIIILVLIAPYRMNRLTSFLHPELDPQGIGYHVNQAYLAIGSGGFWGLGYGHSRQKYLYLPEVQADSIFAVIAEEMGFVVSLALLGLIVLIAWRGLKIAKASGGQYQFLIVGGISVWFFWQACMNIGAMVGLLPLTGVTLPFVSHGGSSLMICLASVGVVASVSRD